MRADIFIRQDIEGWLFKKIVKHELLHALGFGHVEYGIMRPSAEAHDNIDPRQIDAWKQIVEDNGGFVEFQ